jgi:hypothetical protein
MNLKQLRRLYEAGIEIAKSAPDATKNTALKPKIVKPVEQPNSTEHKEVNTLSQEGVPNIDKKTALPNKPVIAGNHKVVTT